MKRALFLIVFFTTCSLGLAQDSVRVHQRELDSLLQLIHVYTAKDSARVKLLNDYSERCFYNLDFLSGLKAANEARAISRQLNFKKGEGLYFKSMAIFHHTRYSTNHRTRYSANLALYYQFQSNRILHAPTHFGPFLSVVIPRGAKDGEMKTIIANLKLALTYFELKNEKESLAHVHFALGVAEQRDNNEGKKSLEHQNKALELFRNVNQSFAVLAILSRKLVDSWIQENEADAKRLELEVANIFSTEQDKEIKALDALLLGITYGENNRAYLAVEYLFNAEEILKESGGNDLLRCVYWNIPFTYMFGNEEKSLEYANKGLDLYDEIEYDNGVEYLYLIIVQNLISLNRIEEINPAFWDRLYRSPKGISIWFDGGLMRAKAEVLKIQNRLPQALQVLRESLKYETVRKSTRAASNSASEIAQYHKEIGRIDSAIVYALLAYRLASETSYLQRQIAVTDLLSQCYEESGKKDKAFEYLKLNKTLNEKSERLSNAARLSDLEVQAVLKKKQREIELLEKESQLKKQENKTQRLWILSITGALLSSVFIAFILVRNNHQKQKANQVLETTLSNLKSTQSQLIQSEKMASLGELTAGIAHEIQNPLNFVNNFSEVNEELLAELKEELNKGKVNDAITLANDAIENQKKINHHGKRADAIVKGMLQHSRTSSGQKEPTDINALCDEHLRLSYHGLRAKDKAFNSRFVTDFDPSLEKINVVPQDIGRVVLNLINNAFYAVSEKKKSLESLPAGQKSYEPTVVVSTKKLDNKVIVNVKDNGNGIPQKVLDKIFQPFFTTKPTGLGTGLGLSLSYDIIKAHGGEINVHTKENEGTEFTIQLPIV